MMCLIDVETYYILIQIKFHIRNTTFIVEHNNPNPRVKMLEGLKSNTNLFKRFLESLNYGFVTR